MARFDDHVTYQLEREIARGENGLGSRKLMMRVQFSFTQPVRMCACLQRKQSKLL